MVLRMAWLAGTAMLALAAPALAQNPAQRPWVGHYRYEWEGGRTAGGSGMAVTYNLRIGNGPADCALDITGFQSDEHILCEVATNGENLWVRFRSYADGKLANKYGTAVYRPGQDLFRLRRQGTAAPVTEWQALNPEERRTPPALRFRKA
ncbi:hypothetical protein EBE87_12510 [Pseudoroseomonas wenyumeiae]|uniref:Uncharacterized protein n=1 Tax=Teichococcus wenyumeiae TaxID=2478470 RepID=A0A3A9JZ21_9PROT|nr:DUF5991 domain-containing protein [Pseudoroseomonas wenyumeiae]RKK04349.1 hypothetical protein D6Z83_09810 [Pseudoroseomonas wenyumeiae]RMI24510.1 hypothetical protein EBE87_12510 [Pseudoroseomonas wenyumeiae]